MGKKILAILSAAAITLSLAACNNNTSTTTSTPNTSSNANSSSSSSNASSSSAAEESSAPVESESEPEKLVSTLSNPNASQSAIKLYNYMKDEVYHNKVLSGQQESTWMDNNNEQYEFEYIFNTTGKYPAMRGLDYMNDDFEGVNRRAEDWHNRGGIVLICWHTGTDFSGSWAESQQTEIADWDKALTEGTDEYNTLIEGMDKGAKALKELCDKDIPVIWKPFHEFDGDWFWWSKGGAENFKKLWQLMYDRYTNHWELNNLLWLLPYSGNLNEIETWYPGDEYVDFVGPDSYDSNLTNDPAFYQEFFKLVGDRKPIPLHENGRIPLPQELREGKVDWVWFMTWHTDHIATETGQKRNPPDRLKEIYNDEYVITLDELPTYNPDYVPASGNSADTTASSDSADSAEVSDSAAA